MGKVAIPRIAAIKLQVRQEKGEEIDPEEDVEPAFEVVHWDDGKLSLIYDK